jgi:mannan endo-1,4-beta-mannosidase
MRRPALIRVLIVGCLIASGLFAAPPDGIDSGKPTRPHPAGTERDAAWTIITRRGDTLYDGDQPFRFFGLAAPNLQAHESQILPDFSNRFPDEFETRDALDTLRRLGARATRTFSLSVATPADGQFPVYIPARRTYNEEAFRCLDRVLALCHEYDVRLIIPVIASQSFGGIRGVDEFSALAGRIERGAFWTDPEVKADYRHLLDFLVNRRNTVNGILYRDEPAILAWQFGNEFGSYAPSGHRASPPGRWRWRYISSALIRATS